METTQAAIVSCIENPQCRFISGRDGPPKKCLVSPNSGRHRRAADVFRRILAGAGRAADSVPPTRSEKGNRQEASLSLGPSVPDHPGEIFPAEASSFFTVLDNAPNCDCDNSCNRDA
jgi:hypothetical protein